MSHPTDPAQLTRQGDAATDKAKPRGPAESPRTTDGADILPYVVPMFAYVGLTALEGYVPQLLGKPQPGFVPDRVWAQAGGRDVAGLALSLDLERFPAAAERGNAHSWHLDGPRRVCGLGGAGRSLPHVHVSGEPLGVRPDGPRSGGAWAFISVRLLGLALVVPVVEELFWRSFLLRWLIDNDFTRVPIGKVTPMAAAVTSALFGLAHPEWLPALLTGALWAWLLWQTKSLSACLISHMTANLAWEFMSSSRMIGNSGEHSADVSIRCCYL